MKGKCECCDVVKELKLLVDNTMCLEICEDCIKHAFETYPGDEGVEDVD